MKGLSRLYQNKPEIVIVSVREKSFAQDPVFAGLKLLLDGFS
jgi:hypothetical protein